MSYSLLNLQNYVTPFFLLGIYSYGIVAKLGIMHAGHDTMIYKVLKSYDESFLMHECTDAVNQVTKYCRLKLFNPGLYQL